MHGFMTPAEVQIEQGPSLRQRLIAVRRKYGWFFIVVLAPTLLFGTYLYGFASDQYQSEAHYLVRGAGGAPTSSGGIGALLGIGGSGGSQGEATSIADFLQSHDAVDSLRKNNDVVAKFRRPEADALSRLPDANPTPEALLRYYRKQIDVHFDPETAITTLKVRAFRPRDAYEIAGALLTLGEKRVNQMNMRAFDDSVSLSRTQRSEAETALRGVQRQMATLRQTSRDVNPAGSADAQIAMVSRMTGDLSAARAQLSTTIQLIGPNNPQVDALRQQVRSLEAQVGAQNARLAGAGSGTIAAGLGSYEALGLQQQFLAKRYDTASTAYEAARQQAIRQQLYVVRVVDANMPVRSDYPQRMTSLLTLFAALMVIYGIGWLIAAGVREHAV